MRRSRVGTFGRHETLRSYANGNVARVSLDIRPELPSSFASPPMNISRGARDIREQIWPEAPATFRQQTCAEAPLTFCPANSGLMRPLFASPPTDVRPLGTGIPPVYVRHALPARCGLGDGANSVRTRTVFVRPERPSRSNTAGRRLAGWGRLVSSRDRTAVLGLASASPACHLYPPEFRRAAEISSEGNPIGTERPRRRSIRKSLYPLPMGVLETVSRTTRPTPA